MACTKQTVRQGHGSAASPVTANIPGRVTINDLPHEVIVNIIRHVPENKYVYSNVPYCQHSLLQLALCSRSLYTLVEPILYEYFYDNILSPVCGVQVFLRVILARPDLARQVKGIQTTTSECEYDYGRFDASRFKDVDWARIKNKIEEVGGNTQERNEWEKGIEKGCWEAMVALILTITPNLQILAFMERWYDNPSYPNLMRTLSRARQLQVEGQTDNLFALWNLNKVVQGACDTKCGLSIENLAPLLAIPSVKTFWGESIHEEFFPSTRWPLSDIDLTHIEELSLLYVSMDHDIIVRFLRCFPRLRKLYYKNGYQHIDFEPPQLMAALSHLQPYLQDLTITNDAHTGCDFEDYPVGPLSSFGLLKRLQIDWQILTGGDNGDYVTDGFLSRQNIIDILPAGLEELRVSGGRYNNNALHDIFSLLEHKHLFPALNMLDLEWGYYRRPDEPGLGGPHVHHTGFTEEQFLEVLSRCNEASVEIAMTTPPPPMIRYINDEDDERI